MEHSEAVITVGYEGTLGAGERVLELTEPEEGLRRAGDAVVASSISTRV